MSGSEHLIDVPTVQSRGKTAEAQGTMLPWNHSIEWAEQPLQAKTQETHAVNGASLITWALVCTGVVASLLLGTRVQTTGAAIALSIVLAVALAVAVSFGIAACVAIRMCAAMGEEGLSYSLYSLGAAPVFWLLMVIRMRMKQS